MDRALIFVDSKHYRGNCRRIQDRFEVKGSVKLNYNDKDQMVKLSNLSRVDVDSSQRTIVVHKLVSISHF